MIINSAEARVFFLDICRVTLHTDTSLTENVTVPLNTVLVILSKYSPLFIAEGHYNT